MLHRLCEPPSIPLSFSLATILPRRGTSRFPYDREPIGEPPIQYPSFTARTTGVSNPVRSPGFRVSASERVQGLAFATGVPSDLNAFHRSTGSSRPPYPLQAARIGARSPVEPGDFSDRRAVPPTRALSPVIPNNVRTVRLTAAAGTNLARASSRDQSSRLPGLLPPRQEFTTRRPSSSTRRRSVRLAPIAEDSRLQPPVGVWAVSQSQCAGPRSHAR